MMLSQLIQRQIAIGSTVIFTLKDGREISGVLIEIGRDHVTLDSTREIVTILTEMIGTWRIAKGPESPNAPQIPTPSAPLAPSTEPLPKEPEELVDQAVTKKLLEIEARFQAQLQESSIHVRVPDFVFPANEIKGKQSDIALAVWNRVKDRYRYAEQINELSAKFGRIQPLAFELGSLAEQFPGSASIKRHLGYLYYLLGKQQESLETYKAAASISNNAWDWYNLASQALASGQDYLACYSLGQFFQTVPNVDEPPTWYVYIGLLRKFSDYQAIRDIAQKRLATASDKELDLLLETGVYLLLAIGNKELATGIVKKWQKGIDVKDLILEAFDHLQERPDEKYQEAISEFKKRILETISEFKKRILLEPKGFIYYYTREHGFGFLKDEKGKTYFFHITAVADDDLLEQLRDSSLRKQIPVVFEASEGPKGPIAIRVTLYRTPDQMFARAQEYANDGDYPKAIALVKKVLEADQNFPSAKEAYDKWREYARISGVPRGSNPYARAKRVQLVEKDLERAAQWLRTAINQGDNVESAVKDLAALLVQLGKRDEAIQVLEKNRKKISNKQSVDNMLIGFYQAAGQHDKAIALLQKKLEQATTESKKSQILWQIATGYLRKEDYTLAEQTFREVLKAQPDNRTAQRNIAICLFKQGRYEESQQILKRILSTALDIQAAELLEVIKQAQTTGQFASIDAIVRETIITEFVAERSKFTAFLLARCDYRGISPDRIKVEDGEQVYVGTRRDARYDIERLEEIARQLGTRRPSERSDYYLTAAKISEKDDPNRFYQYLCRSFASRGDSFVIENKPMDAAIDLYCEALAVYDGYRNPGKSGDKYDEQDAVNALVRCLYSWLGREAVPTTPPKYNEQEPVLQQQLRDIDAAIENFIAKYPQREKAFERIAYLIFRSKYAGERILKSIYSHYTLQVLALDYLKIKGIATSESPKRIEDFIALWNKLQYRRLEDTRYIGAEFKVLATVELYTASLERAVERVKILSDRLFLDLDQQRAKQIQMIFEAALELCRQTAFEEKERLCIQIDNRCQDLLKEIEASPTKISVEEIYPLIEGFQAKIKAYLEDLYESSTPQLSLRLPIETYTPDSNRHVEAQVVVSNREGCSPAESVELVVQGYEETFSVRLDGSLRGGEQKILKIPIRLSEETLAAQAFSLPVYARYRTRSGEIQQTKVSNFSIRLSSEQEFEEIENPYAPYAEGGIVGEPAMFYGRDELITNVTKALEASRTQSKCVVIYGQKRAGKSSILHHLKERLKTREDLLVLDIGNIGAILDEHSTVPFLYQILWTILKKLKYAIEDKVSEGKSALDIPFPEDRDFYQHPSPLVLFKEIFERFCRGIEKLPDWKGTRVILLIDEFSYVYGYIMNGLIPETFMKNWKALLQANFFNAVLVGQDVMPKFKQRFPNEFGTTQDERITYLRKEDAIRLIDEPIRIGGRNGESRYREKAIERILNLTAGSPFYIQILCNRLVEYMNRKRASLVTEADVEQVKDELIRGVNALGRDKFDNLINSGDTSKDAISDDDTLKVLIAIAENSLTGPCSRGNIACETKTSVDEILEDLVRRDVIERERGHYYSIRVGLFREWLLAHR